ncbi:MULTISPECIES: M28 family metallopeptidase [unclassified Marinovum]
MKFSTFPAPSGGAKAARRKAEKSEGWWVQFGDDLFVYSANDKWSDVTKGLAKRNAAQPEGSARKGNMHLVVQKGRTFQQAHPDIPVLLDKGRYLVIDVAPKKVSKLIHKDEVCFEILPLAENSVAFETVQPGATQRSSAAVESVVNAVDAARFGQRLAHLTSYHTRLSSSPEFVQAARWARDELAAMGYGAELTNVTIPGGTSHNVVAHKRGTGAEPREYVVVAHLDSVNHSDGPAAPAPGADDNASGSAGLLELAQVLAGRDTEHDITFVLVGGEEQGLHGSTQYVAGLSQGDRDGIAGVLNMDMIGTVNAMPQAVLLESHPFAQDQIDKMAAAAAAFTSLTVQVSLLPFASDHMPFLDVGIPAVLSIEGTDTANSDIHTGNDTLDKIDTGYGAEILRMNAGYLAEAAVVADAPKPKEDCGCGCGGGESAQSQQVRELARHYQILMAQYARLGPSGWLSNEDRMTWQALRYAHDTLVARTT